MYSRQQSMESADAGKGVFKTSLHILLGALLRLVVSCKGHVVTHGGKLLRAVTRCIARVWACFHMCCQLKLGDQVTSAFLHASWYHLAVNMYCLWCPLLVVRDAASKCKDRDLHYRCCGHEPIKTARFEDPTKDNNHQAWNHSRAGINLSMQ